MVVVPMNAENESLGKVVRVGLSLMIVDPVHSAVLLGVRHGSHGEGEWAFAGGHQEFGETALEGVLREAREEIKNLSVANVRFLRVHDVVRYRPEKQYLEVGFVGEWTSEFHPISAEPEKCSGWYWHPINNLPTPLFDGIMASVEAFRKQNALSRIVVAAKCL